MAVPIYKAQVVTFFFYIYKYHIKRQVHCLSKDRSI